MYIKVNDKPYIDLNIKTFKKSDEKMFIEIKNKLLEG